MNAGGRDQVRGARKQQWTARSKHALGKAAKGTAACLQHASVGVVGRRGLLLLAARDVFIQEGEARHDHVRVADPAHWDEIEHRQQ